MRWERGDRGVGVGVGGLNHKQLIPALDLDSIIERFVCVLDLGEVFNMSLTQNTTFGRECVRVCGQLHDQRSNPLITAGARPLNISSGPNTFITAVGPTP